VQAIESSHKAAAEGGSKSLEDGRGVEEGGTQVKKKRKIPIGGIVRNEKISKRHVFSRRVPSGASEEEKEKGVLGVGIGEWGEGWIGEAGIESDGGEWDGDNGDEGVRGEQDGKRRATVCGGGQSQQV